MVILVHISVHHVSIFTTPPISRSTFLKTTRPSTLFFRQNSFIISIYAKKTEHSSDFDLAVDGENKPEMTDTTEDSLWIQAT